MTATTLLQRLLHPEDLGHAVSAEVRALVRAEIERWSLKPLRVYLAGPMSGLPGWNYPAFHQAAAALRAAGYQVVNPAENGLPPEAHWEQHMRRDIAALLTCGRLALLPGWAASKGAVLEERIARQLGMTVQSVERWIEDARHDQVLTTTEKWEKEEA